MNRLFPLLAGGVCMAALANPIHNQVAALSVEQRAALFTKILNSGGENCGRVLGTMYQGSSRQDDAFWSAGCSSGVDFQIMIRPDAGGSMKVLDCKVLKAVGSRCFVKF